jgi:ubiquinone/menaquinone biosynthesis C-methylase UbiE
MSTSPSAGGSYQHGHHAAVVASHAKRSAEVEAAFFLPHLRPGLRLLDIGCGPGSITVGLAKRVAPAAVIGMDPSASVIKSAEARLREDGSGNLAFETGNIYEPRFEEASFDAIFAHQVLQHLKEPIRALEQVRRLLTPGGVVGARDVDWGSTTFFPQTEGMRRFLELYYELAERNGGQANAGRFMRRWFREAGFETVTTTTSTESYASDAATLAWASTWAERALASNIAEKAIEYGLAKQSDLERMADGWLIWGRDPDATFLFLAYRDYCAARLTSQTVGFLHVRPIQRPLASGARGREFESPRSDQQNQKVSI